MGRYASLICPKCGSKDVIPDVRITEEEYSHPIRATVYEKPHALVLKGACHGKLVATICGRCGFVELFVTNPAELLDVHRQRQARQPMRRL